MFVEPNFICLLNISHPSIAVLQLGLCKFDPVFFFHSLPARRIEGVENTFSGYFRTPTSRSSTYRRDKRAGKPFNSRAHQSPLSKFATVEGPPEMSSSVEKELDLRNTAVLFMYWICR